MKPSVCHHIRVILVCICTLLGGLRSASLVLAQSTPLPATPYLNGKMRPTPPPEVAGMSGTYKVPSGPPFYVYRVSEPGRPVTWVAFKEPTDMKSYRQEMALPMRWTSAATVQKFQLVPKTIIEYSVAGPQAEFNPLTGQFMVLRGGGLQGRVSEGSPTPIPVGQPRMLPQQAPKTPANAGQLGGVNMNVVLQIEAADVKSALARLRSARPNDDDVSWDYEPKGSPQ